jgi:hypothetical protein
MNFRTLIAVIISLCLFGGCGGKGAEDFYPLEQGMTWEYSGVYLGSSGDVEKRAKATVINLAPREIKDPISHSFIVTAQKIDGDITTVIGTTEKTITFEFIATDTDGIFMIAKQGEKDVEPKFFKKNISSYTIINPIKIGTAKKEEYGTSFYEIKLESKTDIVTVPAGTFNDCLKIIRTTKTNKGEMSNISWYAKGIGRIKTIITWPENTKYISQLQSFKK